MSTIIEMALDANDRARLAKVLCAGVVSAGCRHLAMVDVSLPIRKAMSVVVAIGDKLEEED